MKNKSKPTSFDIAHIAGVSQPTVSRALRGSELVSAATREKVQRIAKELNYKVDVNARKLRSNRSNTLALLVFEDPGGGEAFINPFFLSMLGSITRAATDHGYDLLISFQQLSDDWSAEYEDSNKADGLIFLGYGDYKTYIKRAAELDKQNAHFVTWGPVIKNQPEHFIGCDNIDGGYLATDHLLSLGHRQIAFIGETSKSCPEFRDRYKGYRAAHEEYSVDLDTKLQFDADFSEASGYEAVKRLLKSERPFTSIFCCSDLLAIGAIKALRQAGLRVPRDISIVGFDDIHAAEHFSPSLSTIRQDTWLAGKMLVESVIRSIKGEKIESILIPVQLMVRDSTAVPVNLV